MDAHRVAQWIVEALVISMGLSLSAREAAAQIYGDGHCVWSGRRHRTVYAGAQKACTTCFAVSFQEAGYDKVEELHGHQIVQICRDRQCVIVVLGWGKEAKRAGKTTLVLGHQEGVWRC